MINRVVLVGRIVRDPEIKYYGEKKVPCVSFSLAVDRKFSKDKETKETDFVRCVAWNKQAENLFKYVKKGYLLGVEGFVQIGSYENKEKQKITTTQVVCDVIKFLQAKKQETNKNKTENAYVVDVAYLENLKNKKK